MRRDGLPSAALVQRKGDVFKTSTTTLINNVAWFLNVRKRYLRAHGLAKDAFLPIADQKACKEELHSEWAEKGPGLRWMERAPFVVLGV